MSKESFSSTIFEDAKTGKQVWRVYYYDRQGKRHNKSGRTTTKAEAKRAIATLQSDLLKGADFSRRDVTLAEYFDDYLSRYKRGTAASATQLHYDAFSNAISGYWGDKMLRDISPDSWQDFINEYSKTHVAETAQKLNAHVHGMVKVAMANGILQRDFANHVTYPKDKVAADSARKRWLELDDLKKLTDYVFTIANFQAITTYMVAIGIMTGMRYEEIVGLRWSDVDFDKHTIHVGQTWDYKDKDGKEAPTKTPNSVRTLDVPEKLTDLLKRLQAQQKAVFDRQKYVDEHDLVCRTSRHTVPSDNGANKQLRDYETAVGIDEDKQVTFHGLRHSHVAFLAAQKGVEIYYISQRLGHKDVTITLQRYHHLLQHVADQQAGKAVDALSHL